MLIPIDRLIGLPIMSLQTGTELARTTGVIIDPRQMKLAAFYVDGHLLEAHPSVLHPSDIREFSDIGLIVDNSERLMSMDGLVRLQEIIDFGFELKGTKVIDEQGRKLGKVADFALEPGDFTVQQLYTHQSILRSLGTMSNVIHRSQIVSVRNDQIVVKSPTVRDEAKGATASQPARPFVNPFRGSQPES